MKINILTIASVLISGLITTSCMNSFLEQKNTTNINQETFFDSDAAISQATGPLYNYVWFSFNDKLYYSMGDGRSNNITAQWSNYINVYTNFNETSISEGLQDAWGALYSVVAQSNNTINNIKTMSTSNVSETAKNQGIAEARYMRGVAYWYLASLWGNVIIYENVSDLVDNYVVPTNPQADAMEFALRDLEYAAMYLPETSPQAGRINKYSAYGMLSRLYLSMAGITTDGEYNGSNIRTDFNGGTRNQYYLDLARKAAEKVINGSGFKLMDNYYDLFTIANNNNSEALFQLQWMPGTTAAVGYGGNQTISSYFGWSTMVSDGTNWGGATNVSWDLFQEYEAGDARKHASVASYGEVYPDMNTKGGGYTYGVTESPSTNGANIKKYVVGTHDDNGVSYQQSSAVNTTMLRLAEVYLNLADAILGNNASTSDAEALQYFNAVRTRAGLPAVTSIDYLTLRHEYRVETAFEGQFWYFLLRRAYTNQEEVIGYLNSQDRNRVYTYNTDIAQYEPSENAPQGVNAATKASFLLPYSDADQNKNEYLKRDAVPVPYEFGEPEVTTSSLFQ